MTRVKYVTPAMVERAAQECSARASWWLTGFAKVMEAPDATTLLAWDVWRDVDIDTDAIERRDAPLEPWSTEAHAWAEAEARLREGRLPDGWAWRCPARVADRCDGSCVRFDAVIATAWAPGKGPSL